MSFIYPIAVDYKPFTAPSIAAVECLSLPLFFFFQGGREVQRGRVRGREEGGGRGRDGVKGWVASYIVLS